MKQKRYGGKSSIDHSLWRIDPTLRQKGRYGDQWNRRQQAENISAYVCKMDPDEWTVAIVFDQ